MNKSLYRDVFGFIFWDWELVCLMMNFTLKSWETAPLCEIDGSWRGQ